MFCVNCGKSLPEGSKFCDGCGMQINDNPNTEQNPTAYANKPKSKGKKTGGIILTVLGLLSILGSISNDFYWNISHNGANLSDMITIGIQIACVVVGIYLIYKSKTDN